MAHIFFSKPAERDLKHLPYSAAEALRREAIPRLTANPRAGKMLHGPLRGYFSDELWADGIAYRIAYEIVHRDVIILMIDTRDNFYQKFSRRI